MQEKNKKFEEAKAAYFETVNENKHIHDETKKDKNQTIKFAFITLRTTAAVELFYKTYKYSTSDRTCLSICRLCCSSKYQKL